MAFREKIGLPEREAGELRSDLHHLLLIDDDAEGVLQNLLELGELVANVHLASFAADEVIDHPAPDRAGTVQCVECGQIAQLLRLEAPENVPHAITLELKHTKRPTFREKLVGLRVIQR